MRVSELASRMSHPLPPAFSQLLSQSPTTITTALPISHNPEDMLPWLATQARIIKQNHRRICTQQELRGRLKGIETRHRQWVEDLVAGYAGDLGDWARSTWHGYEARVRGLVREYAGLVGELGLVIEEARSGLAAYKLGQSQGSQGQSIVSESDYLLHYSKCSQLLQLLLRLPASSAEPHLPTTTHSLTLLHNYHSHSQLAILIQISHSYHLHIYAISSLHQCKPYNIFDSQQVIGQLGDELVMGSGFYGRVLGEVVGWEYAGVVEGSIGHLEGEVSEFMEASEVSKVQGLKGRIRVMIEELNCFRVVYFAQLKQKVDSLTARLSILLSELSSHRPQAPITQQTNHTTRKLEYETPLRITPTHTNHPTSTASMMPQITYGRQCGTSNRQSIIRVQVQSQQSLITEEQEQQVDHPSLQGAFTGLRQQFEQYIEYYWSKHMPAPHDLLLHQLHPQADRKPTLTSALARIKHKVQSYQHKLGTLSPHNSRSPMHSTLKLLLHLVTLSHPHMLALAQQHLTFDDRPWRDGLTIYQNSLTQYTQSIAQLPPHSTAYSPVSKYFREYTMVGELVGEVLAEVGDMWGLCRGQQQGRGGGLAARAVQVGSEADLGYVEVLWRCKLRIEDGIQNLESLPQYSKSALGLCRQVYLDFQHRFNLACPYPAPSLLFLTHRLRNALNLTLNHPQIFSTFRTILSHYLHSLKQDQTQLRQVCTEMLQLQNEIEEICGLGGSVVPVGEAGITEFVGLVQGYRRQMGVARELLGLLQVGGTGLLLREKIGEGLGEEPG